MERLFTLNNTALTTGFSGRVELAVINADLPLISGHVE